MGNIQEIEEKKKEYLKVLQSDFNYGIKKFDTQSLYLSSGALAISLTFIKDIVPIKDAICLPLYYISLSLFVLTILVGFIAHYYSSNQILEQIKNVENDTIITKNKDYVIWMNITIMTSLILGISFLILFSILNMININKIESTKLQTNKILIQKSLNDSILIQIKGEIKDCIYIDTSNHNKK